MGVVFKFSPLASAPLALGMRLALLLSTLVFEFGLRRFVSHLTRSETLAASGRLWVLVPIWVALAPYVFYTLQERR